MLAFESYSCFIMKSSRSERLLFKKLYAYNSLMYFVSDSTSFWWSDDSEIKRSGVELTSLVICTAGPKVDFIRKWNWKLRWHCLREHYCLDKGNNRYDRIKKEIINSKALIASQVEVVNQTIDTEIPEDEVPTMIRMNKKANVMRKYVKLVE